MTSSSEQTTALIATVRAWQMGTGAINGEEILVQLADALEDERGHIQSLAKWVGVDEATDSLGIACEVSSALEGEGQWEYGWAREGVTPHPQAREEAEWYAANLEPKGTYTVMRRRPAGPWFVVGGTE